MGGGGERGEACKRKELTLFETLAAQNVQLASLNSL